MPPSSPAATWLDHPSDRPVGANVEACASPSTPGLQLDERPELREARDAAGAHLADLVGCVAPSTTDRR